MQYPLLSFLLHPKMQMFIQTFVKHKEVVGIFSHCPMVYVSQNPRYLGNAMLKIAFRHDREEIAQRIRLNLMGRLCRECVDSPGLQVYLDRQVEDHPSRSILWMSMAQISSNCSSMYKESQMKSEHSKDPPLVAGHAQKVTSKSLESVSTNFFFPDRKEAEKELGKVQVVQKLSGVLHIYLKDCCTVFYQKHSRTIKQLFGCTVLYWLALFNWLHMLGILICKLFTASCTLGCGCQTFVKDHQSTWPCASLCHHADVEWVECWRCFNFSGKIPSKRPRFILILDRRKLKLLEISDWLNLSEHSHLIKVHLHGISPFDGECLGSWFSYSSVANKFEVVDSPLQSLHLAAQSTGTCLRLFYELGWALSQIWRHKHYGLDLHNEPHQDIIQNPQSQQSSGKETLEWWTLTVASLPPWPHDTHVTSYRLPVCSLYASFKVLMPWHSIPLQVDTLEPLPRDNHVTSGRLPTYSLRGLIPM